MTPFAVLRSRPFASFVHNVDVRALPFSSPKKTEPDPAFLLDAHSAVTSTVNLTSFTCTVVNAVPSFLVPLQSKERLQHLRINSNLTAAQAALLVNIDHLRSLVLDSASLHVLNVLPEWTERMKKTLTFLTLNVRP